uniref:RNA-directed DNA polymerase n=1 Tax=Strongyloides stercoralis TaxID=6248 RepID=A0A0K0EP90_STRER
MRGLAIQSLLYKGQGLITQLTSQEWRALFINMFEQHYVDDRNLNILRTKIFSLIQQRILPLYTEACRRSQAEYVAITHTKDPSEKMRIFLNRRDIRASFVENHYIIQKCIDVDPEAIFSDYRYNSTCYPLMPILVKRALKFVDKDGYIRQYAQGIPCIQDTSTASSSEQDEESNNFVINFDSFWDRVIWFVSHGSDILGVLKFFLFSIGGVIGTIVVLFGIWKCYVGVRKIKTWYTKRCVRKRHRNNIKQKMEKIIELSSLQQRQVNSIGSAHGKQTCLDLYIRIKDRQQVVRCLLDSGACLSFINKSVIRECTELQNFAMPTKIAEDFNGNPILAIGKCKIPFIMGAKSVYLPFWILESLNPDVLLGADALEYLDQANCTVSFKLASNTIQIGSVKHPLASISRVTFLSPGDIWKSAKAWLWQIRQLSQETDQLMDELRIVDLEVPEELTKDLAIWEMLPDNHTLRHIDLTGTQFSTIGQTRLRALLHKYATAFIQHEHDIGRYNGHIQHTIHLKADAKLPAAGVPRHSPKTKDSAKTLIDNMLQQGIIQSSTSRCTSRYLLVPKPNGTDRFVVDYRQLNMNSHMEIPCIPHIEDILNTVCQFNWFSVFDVASGFHQIPLHPKCRWLTAFNSPWGVYEYITTPMGLSGSPGTFQRIMDHLFWDLKSSILIYIDDIIIFSADEDSHMKTITIFLQRITEAGLKLRLDKSRFGVKELKYLGFLISANGISPDPEKLSIIQNLPPPKDLRHLRGFLGMMNFFRRFIRNYAVITAPLCELLKKGVIFHWSTLCQDAFDTLIKCLMNAPILSPPIPNGEFLLYTDASYTGLGAVLLQKQPELRVITYLSRSINAFERNYPPI